MAEKDIAEKTLEAYNDVFADIINVLLFDGRLLVKEDELTEDSIHSSYKADGKLIMTCRSGCFLMTERLTGRSF